MNANAIQHYYATIARFYDAETAGRGDLPCWQSLVGAWKPRRIVEYGCGSGRIAVPIAKQAAEWGGRVCGIDLSDAMLRLAHDRWTRDGNEAPVSSLTLRRGDIRRDNGGGEVDLVVLADDPLTHLARDADLAAVFRRIGERLRPGGHLAVDASLLPPEAMDRRSSVVVRSSCAVVLANDMLEVDQERRIDPLRREAQVSLRYQTTSGVTQHAQFTAHYLDVDTLTELFALAGCRVDDRWRDFQYRPLIEASGMALVTGTRR